MLDKMLDAVSSVPRVETKLYSTEGTHPKPNLKPVIDPLVLENAKEKVSMDRITDVLAV